MTIDISLMMLINYLRLSQNLLALPQHSPMLPSHHLSYPSYRRPFHHRFRCIHHLLFRLLFRLPSRLQFQLQFQRLCQGGPHQLPRCPSSLLKPYQLFIKVKMVDCHRTTPNNIRIRHLIPIKMLLLRDSRTRPCELG